MSRARIYVVDDDEAFRTIVADALASRGYAVGQAASGRAAKEAAAAFKPDLFLLDVMMPDLDGVTLCRELRAQPGLGEVPVIITSALGDPQTVSDALLFGATDYLVKPVELAALEAKIEKVLKDAESRKRSR